MSSFCVYILASGKYGTLYVGITNSIIRRVQEHKDKLVPGFTSRYGVDRLVYFTSFNTPEQAIRFEKQLKRWRREWKIQLIEKDNTNWDDLFVQLRSPSADVKPVFLDPDNPPSWWSAKGSPPPAVIPAAARSAESRDP